MSIGGGKPAQQSVNNETQPWEPQQDYLKDLFRQAESISKRPVQMFPGSQIAPQSQVSDQAAQNLLGTAGQLQQDSVPQLMQAMNFGLGDVLSPDSNPYLQQAAAGATKNLTDAFSSQVLPQIRSQAVGTGNTDSTRRGIAEGVAARGLQDTIGDMTGQMYNRAYANNLDAFIKTMGLAPQTMQAATLPSQFQDVVGQRETGLDQQALNEAIQRHNFAQMEPISRLAQFQNFITGNYGNQTSQQMIGAQQPGTTGSQALGGALGGAQLGSMIPGVGTGIGALGGLALSFLT